MPMDFSILFKLAALGLITFAVNSLLKSGGKDEFSPFVTMAALVLALLMVLDLVVGLFDNIRSVFALF